MNDEYMKKSEVMQTITNHADFKTFVDDDAYQKLLTDLDCIMCYTIKYPIPVQPTIKPDEIKPENDAVEHPAHYTSGGIECIDCIKAALGENFIGFLMGNVIKYSYRYKHKNGIEDLKKARWYLDRAIKEVEQNDER